MLLTPTVALLQSVQNTHVSAQGLCLLVLVVCNRHPLSRLSWTAVKSPYQTIIIIFFFVFLRRKWCLAKKGKNEKERQLSVQDLWKASKVGWNWSSGTFYSLPQNQARQLICRPSSWYWNYIEILQDNSLPSLFFFVALLQVKAEKSKDAVQPVAETAAKATPTHKPLARHQPARAKLTEEALHQHNRFQVCLHTVWVVRIMMYMCHTCTGGLARRCCRRFDPRSCHFLHFLLSSSSLSLLSFKTYISPLYTKLFHSWRFSAAFLLSLAPIRPACSLFLASFPSFSLWPAPIDHVSPNRCLKARHEADSFRTGRVVWATNIQAGGRSPLLSLSFLSLLLLLLFLSSLSKPIFLLPTRNCHPCT